MQLKTCALYWIVYSENFYLIFLDHGWPRITEIVESETVDKGGQGGRFCNNKITDHHCYHLPVSLKPFCAPVLQQPPLGKHPELYVDILFHHLCLFTYTFIGVSRLRFTLWSSHYLYDLGQVNLFLWTCFLIFKMDYFIEVLYN